MNFPVKIGGMEGQTIEVATSFWSTPKLLVNGEPAPKGARRREYILLKDDGTTSVVSWKPQLFGIDIPQLLVDNQIIPVVAPLKWYQIAWSVFPVSLLFVGGALGAIFGILGFYSNTRVFRMPMNGFYKYLITTCISLFILVVYVTLASMLTNSIPK